VKHASLRGAIVSALLGLTGLGVFLSGNEACATRECVGGLPTIEYYGGGLVDPDTWESAPVAGPWLHYPPASVVQVEIPQFANREVGLITAYLSGSPTPLNANNFAEASGNLAQFPLVTTTCGSGPNVGESVLRILVQNGTCADYYIRVVVTAGPAEAGIIDPCAPVVDDAGASDADADADTDADTDADAGAPDADSADATLD
jgi:hypothetical protein